MTGFTVRNMQTTAGSTAIAASLTELRALSLDIQDNARAFQQNLAAVAASDALVNMRRLLTSIR